MKQHTIFYGSSNTRDLIGHMMYNTNYERLLLWSLSKKLQRLSKSKAWEDCLLLSPVQIRMEQNTNRILEREENVDRNKNKNEIKSCGCKRRKEWTLEGRTKNRQIRIHFNSFTNASLLRWGWICKGTPFGSRKTYRKIFETRGGSSSC